MKPSCVSLLQNMFASSIFFQEMELKEQQMVNMCERERDLETQIQELGRKIKEYEGGTSDAAYINKLEA